MTDAGRTFAINRLTSAPTETALRIVWNSLGREYQRDPVVQETKDTMKASLSENCRCTTR